MHAFMGMFLLLMAVVLYWIPSVVAAARQAPDLGAVIVINCFTGWSFIGWIIALAMSFRDRKAA